MENGSKTASDSVPDAYQIGQWTFYTSVFRLENDQQSVKLEPRVARLLSFLVENAGQPVSRKSIMETVWPGTVVGDEALTNAINKLRKAFDDDRQNPGVIETIPKAGYRLIASVKPVDSQPVVQETAPRNTPQARRQYQPMFITGLVIVFIGLLYSLWAINKPDVPPPEQVESQAVFSDNPSIAVLPFDNLSDDPQQEYFADGITDDIITHLAKNPELMVIARDSSFFYKNTKLDLASIASKLNVMHILRGSIRRIDDQLVINAQLVNTGSGVHAWAEHYTRPSGDLFKIENEISYHVTNALLNRTPENAMQPARIPTRHSQAHEYLLLGRYDFYKFASKADNTHAQNMFREAIRLDPEYALAYALLGWTYDFEAMNGWADDRLAALKKAEELAGKAIELQPDLPLSYYVRGLSYREQGQTIKALGEAETGLKYDPNNANAHVLLATLLYYAGRPDVGLERIKEAMALNPHHPYNYEFHLGQAYFILHQYREAIEAFQRGIASNPSAERLHVWLAASLAHSGDIDSATWEAEQVMTANPEFSVARMQETFPFRDPADMKHFIDGLRMAGLE